jgi:hypothetical protein
MSSILAGSCTNGPFRSSLVMEYSVDGNDGFGGQLIPERAAPSGVGRQIVDFSERGDGLIEARRNLAVDLAGGNVGAIEQDLRLDDGRIDLLAWIELGEIGGDEGEWIHLRRLRRQRQKNWN